MAIKINLDQWADGKAPDAVVSSGAQKDQWQNGNLGATQAHYNEGEYVPYRTAMTGLIEGHSYTITISWDTTQGGKHALDYIGTYDYSFIGRLGETTPNATSGVTGTFLTSGYTTYAIPTDPNAVNQTAGQFQMYGGTITSVSGYTLSGSYGGNSTTSLTITFTVNSDGDATLNELASVVLAWGGHIATRSDWGDGNSAVAISGSPFHMRLEGFTSITDPTEIKNVGQQDRSLSNDAVTFPGEIVVHKETTPDGSSQTFNFVLERSNTVDVIAGKFDLTGDQLITADDTGTFTDSGGEVFTVTSGVISDNPGGDGTVNGMTIASFGSSTNILNIAGIGDAAFTLADGGTKTFGGIIDFSSYTVRETLPSNWLSDGIDLVESDPMKSGDVTSHVSGTSTTISVTEGDSWLLTFNNRFNSNPAMTVVKSADVTSVDAANDVITYTYVVTNTGNVALHNITLVDDKFTPADTNDDEQISLVGLAGMSNLDGGTTANDLAVGSSVTVTRTYTVTQQDMDTRTSLVNVATADSDETAPVTDDATVTITKLPSMTLVKSANTPLVSSAGDQITYTYTITNTGNVALTNITLWDDNFTPANTGDDVNLFSSLTGLTDVDGDNNLDDLAAGASATATYVVTVTQAQIDAGASLVNVATADSTETAPSTDTETVGVFRPVTFTGHPQFNFPNDVSKIQPKLQGGSFTINPYAYVSWDLFTSNSDLAQIKLGSGTSDYSGLKVSIVRVWSDGAATGSDAIYRVYVANETNSAISLANNTNIVSYEIVKGDGVTPAASTDKGLIDLVNADPLIGNFNNFSNIENALLKDATNNFMTAPAAATGSADRIWISTDETGTGTADTAKTLNALAGNDVIYGGSAGDTLSGGDNNDMIDGRGGSDVINGGTGADYLFGSLGNDTIHGGDGNDFLFGSYGHDTVYGDGGSDIFVLRYGDLDSLPDYNPAEDSIWVWIDKLDSTAASGPAKVSYDSATGLLSLSLTGNSADFSPIAQLATGLTIDTTTLNSASGDIFLT